MHKLNYSIKQVLAFFGKALLILICMVLYSPETFSQQAELFRNGKRQLALNRAIDIYDNQIGRNALIYTGRSYYDQYQNIKGNQFFIDEYWEYGRVSYDGYTYDSIYLMYDIYQDVLLIENFNSNGFLSPIKLFSPRVSSFQLNGYDFIRLEKDTTSNLREGFYNVMYEGKALQVLVKRRKEIVNSNEINSVLEEFTEKDRYYLKKGEVYYQVRKKGSILKVLKDHKKPLKTFMRENNYHFKINPDLQLVEVAKYYDSLL